MDEVAIKCGDESIKIVILSYMDLSLDSIHTK